MKQKLFALCAFLALSACAVSPENRFYLLTSPDHDAGAAGSTLLPQLSVTVPAYIDRPQIVMQNGDGEVDIQEFDRWAEPSDSMIRRVLSQDIAAHGVRSATTVAVAIEEFTFDEDADQAILKARWTVSPRNAKKNLDSHEFSRTTTANTGDVTASVAAMSGLLDQLGEEIAGTAH